MITVGIPIYNAELYLAEAINSVLAQSYKDWELILIDDGSIDSSLEIAQKFEQCDKRIRVISDGKNKRLPARLNQIVKEAQSEYIARMDADDIMHPKRLERQLQILKANPKIDVLGTNAYTIDENDLVFGRRLLETEGLQKVECFIHPTIMGKKQWFVNNPYDEKAIRIEDTELWYRTKKFSNFIITNEPLLFYREFGGGYYKKYIKANTSKEYMLEKYPNDRYWKSFFLKNLSKSLVYKIADILNKEQVLVNKRNEVLFEEKENIHFFLRN